VFLGALIAYSHLGLSWWRFIGFLLAPDISMLGYLISNSVGATVYNLFHNYFLPGLVSLVTLNVSSPIFLCIAIIWIAHIGMDRIFGYGLKYKDDFKHTHLVEV